MSFKKIFAALIATVMVISLSVPAMAFGKETEEEIFIPEEEEIPAEEIPEEEPIPEVGTDFAWFEAEKNYGPVIASGTCGTDNNLLWLLNSEGLLTIGGSGAIEDYSYETVSGTTLTTAPWAEYAESIKSFVIMKGVTAIGNNAFHGCTGLESEFELPEGLTRIGDYAFFGCTGLKGSVVIPETVTEIGYAVFGNCGSLDGNLVLPESIKTIPALAFYNCSKLKGEISIPENVTSIGSRAFSNCSGFSGSLVIPENVKSIDEGAFNRCSGLNGSIVLPKNLKTIPKDAFKGCSSLTGSIFIPESVTEIASGAFYGCGATNYYLNGNAPSVTAAGGTSASFDKDSDIIHYDKRKSGWSSPVWNGYNTVAGSRVVGFGFCGGEGDGKNLTWIVNSDGILTVNGSGKMENYFSKYSLESNKTVSTAPWEEHSKIIKTLVIEEGITSIGEYAFYNFPNIKGNLNLPASVNSIGTSAFANCSGFTGKLVIPNGITRLENIAFSHCSGFTSVEMGKNITYIGNAVFRFCSGIKGEVVIPPNISVIGNYAFQDCTNMTSAYFKGNAPKVTPASETERSFDSNITLYYESSKAGWEVNSEGKWEGYRALDRNYKPRCEITVGKASAGLGGTVEIPVKLSNNTGFSDCKMTVKYNSGAFRLKEIKIGILGKDANADIKTGTVTFDASDNLTQNGTLFTLVFEVAKNVQHGNYEISVDITEIRDENNAEVLFRTEKGMITVGNQLMGDANGDGNISSRDATRILQYLVGSLGNNSIDTEASDFNGDGSVSSRDATAILKFLIST